MLDGAVLGKQELEDTFSFEQTALRQADLTDANLFKADLTDAKLLGADLTDAELLGADLTDADLHDADLSDAKLFEADLTDADLSKADLTDADLFKADLTDANLGGADLSDAKLFEADLTDAYLSEADLTDAAFAGAMLGETYLPAGEALQEADLSEVDLEGQDLRDADLSGAMLAKANLTGADLSGADLSGANLERALLNRADLFDTRLAGAHLEGTVFGNVQINEGTFERLEPDDSSYSEQGLLDTFWKVVLGPTGWDAYRCVYDDTSQFTLPETTQPDEEIEAQSDGGEKNAEIGDDPAVRAGGVYRQFERLAADNALPKWQRRFFILRQDMQTRQKTGVNYWFALLQRALFGYGESFGRVIGWSGAIVTVFSLIYLAGGWVRPVNPGGKLGRPVSWTQLPGDPSVIWDSFYYSTLTFTALGFGDFRPTTTLGQFFTILETAGGALLLALLVFVLGRRAAR